MIDIPAGVRIRSTLRPGAVFYFVEESHAGDTPHFFVVVNRDPQNDPILLLVNPTSKVDRAKRRRGSFPPKTLVEVAPSKYPHFSLPSLFDCNSITRKTVDDVIQKLEDEKLKQCPNMRSCVLHRLQAGVLASPTVERNLKTMLRGNETDR